MSVQADVTLARACRQALDLLRTPPAYPADVHRNIESVDLLLSAAIAMYERAEKDG